MMRGRRRPTRARDVSPDVILQAFEPAVARSAGELRRLVRETIPTATEHGYPGWRAIGYRDPQAGYFCGIFPQIASVRLIFEHGIRLDDPDGVLQGAGRQVRFIEITPDEVIPEQAIRRLLRAAIRLGSV